MALGVMAETLRKTGLMRLRLGRPKIIYMAPTINVATEIGKRTKSKNLMAQSYVAAHKDLTEGAKTSCKSLDTCKGSVILRNESSMLSSAMMRDVMKIKCSYVCDDR